MKDAAKTVLITGAARRIGRAIALDLAKAGWSVAIHCHNATVEADDTVAEIREAGGTAVALMADLADAKATCALVPEAASALSAPLTALINNASLFEKDDIADLAVESWDRHQAVNLRAPVLLAQAFNKALPGGVMGNIVNIIDQRVLKLNPQYMSYTASKAGLWTVTQTLAQALAPRVRVNAVAPGPTLRNARQSAEEFAAEQARTLLGCGPTPEEICTTVRFLLETPSVTGQMIALDGGQHLKWRTDDILED
ncbi:SDR family oxidoreductase [Kordiimonas sp. A6E486]|nr:SDR family oxidoreductase [Kordiimonas marina]